MDEPNVVVQRALPTEPSVRSSASLFMTEAERQGIRADRRMLFVGPEPASVRVAAALQVDPGDPVIARRKLLLANDVPVRIATSFFRTDLFGGTRLAEEGFVHPSLQAALRDLGYEFGRAEEYLVARPTAGSERDTLELGEAEWVVQILRTSYTPQDTPVHSLETVCAATRHIFPIAQTTAPDEL